ALHGGSSTGDERLREAVARGIRKVSIFTDMSVRAVAGIRAALAEDARATLVTLLGHAKQAFGEVSEHYIRLFGSAGKA
ncbi:MAG: class II fructose-bisphosphate aldolase, partial [Chloroflexota bacterium]